MERMLAALYDSRYVRAFQPPLAPSFSEDVEELPWHDGALRYARRDEPVVTGVLIGNISNTIQILIPALTAVLILRQWFRQRTRSRIEDDLGRYLSRILQLESEAMELGPELSRGDLPRLRALQDRLGRLKGEALARFGEGEPAGSGPVDQILMQVNDVRAYISGLILQAAVGADRAPAGPPTPFEGVPADEAVPRVS